MFPDFEKLTKEAELEFSSPSSELELLSLEKEIGLELPPSYRKLLTQYGSSSHDEFFSPGQIAAWTKEIRDILGFPGHYLVFSVSDDEAFSLFDTSKRDSAGECPVAFIDFSELPDRHFSAVPEDYPMGLESFESYLRNSVCF